MRKLLRAAAAAGLLISASGALAQVPAGSVIWINRDLSDLNNVNQTLQLWNSATNTTTVLFDLPNSVGPNPLGGQSNGGSSISDIFERNGRWYLSDGPFPPENPLTGRIWQIDDLFGTPVMTELSGPSTAGNVLSRPLGFAWDEVRNQLLVINNPGSDPFPPMPRVEGIIGIDPVTGAQTLLFDETASFLANPVRPAYSGPGRMVADPLGNQNRLYVASVNGGTLNGSAETSNLVRMDFDDVSGQYIPTSILDFGDATTNGLGVPVNGVSTITAAPGENKLWMTSTGAQALFEIVLDAMGNVDSITTLVSGISPSSDMEYDIFNHALVFGEGTRVVRYNLLTDTLDVLVEGVATRGVWVVPAPSTLALLGLGGLVATRRRR